MFISSSTFEDVQVKTDQIWMFQRYRLVFEYFDSTFLPPPISYLEYCISLFKYFTSKNEDKSSQEEDLGKIDIPVGDNLTLIIFVSKEL